MKYLNTKNGITLPVLALAMGTSSPAFSYNFDNFHQRFNIHMQDAYRGLQESVEASQYTSTSSMRYFDEQANAYIIKLRTTIPKEQLSISLEKNYLVVTGNHKDDKSKHNFSQTMSLPKYADKEQISAKYTDQILTITIPRKTAESNQPRTIEIE